MGGEQVDVVVAGHICLDLIPQLGKSQTRPEDLFAPGRLIQIGPATIALGGAVANTGLAMHRLGAATRLMGKVGDDLLGETILQSLRSHEPALAEGMIVARGEPSSYTIVVEPPGLDRCFLHCPATNDTFVAEDLALDRVAGARLLHFGYPAIMQGIYADGGDGLAERFHEIRQQGTLVSLDTAMPDPASPAGRVDWPAWLARVLPEVDILLPSLDEVLLMFDRGKYDELVQQAGGGNPVAVADGRLLDDMAARLLDLGAGIVVLKLGDQGTYLRTDENVCRLAECASWAEMDWQRWQNRQLLAPCFDVEVAGTTGAGDCTIAGFLAGLLHGLSPEETLRCAVGVGACNVQSPDATSGIPSWSEVQERLAGWDRRNVQITLDGWHKNDKAGLYIGPHDS